LASQNRQKSLRAQKILLTEQPGIPQR